MISLSSTIASLTSTGPGRSLPAIPERTIAAALIVLGAILAFATIGQESLWIDEGYTHAISQLPLDRLATVPFDAHPPGYYILVQIALLFGDGEVVMRSVSGIASVIGSVLFYVLARRVIGGVGALVALAVWVAEYTYLVYANDARNYAVLLALFLGAYLSLETCVRQLTTDPATPFRKIALPAGLYMLCATASLYVHAISVFYILSLNAVMWAAMILFNRAAFVRTTILLTVVNLVVLALGAPRLLVTMGTAPDFSWLIQSKPDDALHTLVVVIGPNDTSILAVAAYFICLAAGAVLIFLRRDWASVAVAFSVAIYPAVVWMAGYVVRPVYMERTILPALLGGALCAGAAAAFLKPRIGAIVLSAVALIVIGLSTTAYLNRGNRQPTYGAHLVQDFRSAVGAVDAPDTAIIVDMPFTHAAVDFYRKSATIFVKGPSGLWAMNGEEWRALFGAPVAVRAPDSLGLMEKQMRERGTTPLQPAQLTTKYLRVALIGAANFSATTFSDTSQLMMALKAAGYAGEPQTGFRGLDVVVLHRQGAMPPS